MYSIGDRVRVRFNLSKIRGMDKFVEKAKGEHNDCISPNYPIGVAYGKIIGKGYNKLLPKRLAPYAVVQFGKQQTVCGCYDVSGAAMAVSLEEGPDLYGARIVDEKGAVYTEAGKILT